MPNGNIPGKKDSRLNLSTTQSLVGSVQFELPIDGAQGECFLAKATT